MGPAPMRQSVRTLKAGELGKLAVKLGANRFSYDEGRTALGMISNLYCLYALEHPEVHVVSFKKFVSDPIATERAIELEIAKAVSRRHLARAIYDALVQAFDQMAAEAHEVRIRGFGRLIAAENEPNVWTLTVELPTLSAESSESGAFASAY